MRSYFEIGGIVLDGSTRYDHRKFKRISRAISKDKPRIAAIGMSDLVINTVVDKTNSKDIPYSEWQLTMQEWTSKNRRRMQGLIRAAPVSTPVAVAAIGGLTAIELLSYAVGSFDMVTPEIRAYEESLTLSGMTSRVI